MGSLNTEDRTFTCNDGTVFTLRPLAPLVLERVKNDQHGKPQPPIVETQLGKNGPRRKEANPLDPDYQVALAEWEQTKNARLLTFIFTMGIAEEPDETEAERWKPFFPGLDAVATKYLWIVDHLKEADEVQQLSETIMGQTVVTEGGLEAAAATFPGES